MPFSHEQMKAKELIEEELETTVSLSTILEQGKFNDYLSPKYMQLIKNNDEFDKIVNDCLLRHGYKII